MVYHKPFFLHLPQLIQFFHELFIRLEFVEEFFDLALPSSTSGKVPRREEGRHPVSVPGGSHQCRERSRNYTHMKGGITDNGKESQGREEEGRQETLS